jgi:membrane protein YdbS with pleckstrin-like domain
LDHLDRDRIRREAEAEAIQAQEQEARIQLRLQKWKRGTVWLGSALVLSVAAVVPFLYGFPLHDKWDAIGKKILLLSMCLLAVFMYVAGTTYNFWAYLRDTKKGHKKFAPPGSGYRLGK